MTVLNRKIQLVLVVLLALMATSVSTALTPSADAQNLSCTEGVLVGTNCVIGGAAPTATPPTCPTSSVVFEDNGDCYQLVPPVTSSSCPAPFTPFGTVCELHNPDPFNPQFTCPAGASDESHTSGGVLLISRCTISPTITTTCPPGTTTEIDGCRQPVQRASGGLVCQDDFIFDGTQCVLIVPASSAGNGGTFFAPTTPSRLTVTYQLTCFGQIARLTDLDIDSQGGASLQLLTLNGSLAIGQDLAPGSAAQLGVFTNSSTDTVIVNGPTTAPACDGTAAGSTTTSTTTQTTGGVTNEVVGPLGSGPITALVTGQDVSLQVPGALAIWLSPNNDILVTVDGITVATAPASDGSVSFVVPAGDRLPTSVSFHGRLLNGTAYREVVSIP